MTARTFPHVALSAHAHNRLGLQRTDAEWLDRVWADPETRVLVVSGTRVRSRGERLRWVPPAEAAYDGTRVLLGERDGVVHLALLIDPADAPGEREEWLPIRALLMALEQDVGQDGLGEAPLLLHAIGMAEWHWATRFCPRCGGRLEPRAAGHELRCTACERPQFPRTDAAVIMAVTHGPPGTPEEALLLGRQAAWPEGRWSTLAGFLEPGETLEDAVRREVAEEVGVEVGAVTWFGNQPWPLPASLMLGFTAQALTRDIDVDGAEIAEARWWTRDQLTEACGSGEIRVPRSVSISSALIESWYGGPLPGPGWS